jgi:hypothetical protein
MLVQWVFFHIEDTMQEQKASQLFLQTVQEIGLRIGLAPEMIAAGSPIEFNGMAFWIGQDPQKDPDGLVAYVDLGVVKREFEAVVYRYVLQCNAAVHCSLSGHYCLLPDTGRLAFSVRIDLAKSATPADTVLTYIGIVANQTHQLEAVMSEGLAAARNQVARDAVAAASAAAGSPA